MSNKFFTTDRNDDGMTCTIFQEKDFKKSHEFYSRPPNEWAAERGATHTLWLGEGCVKGTRPAKLKATVAYVGVDENEDGSIKWEKWLGKTLVVWPRSPVVLSNPYTRKS